MIHAQLKELATRELRAIVVVLETAQSAHLAEATTDDATNALERLRYVLTVRDVATARMAVEPVGPYARPAWVLEVIEVQRRGETR